MTNVLSFIPTDSHVCTTPGTNSDRTALGHDTSHGTESNKIIRHFIKELFNRNFKHDYIWTQHPMTSKKRPKHESVNVLLRPLARFETDLWSRYPFNDSLNQSPSQNIITKKTTSGKMQKQDDTFQTWHEHYRTEADETDIKVLDPKKSSPGSWTGRRRRATATGFILDPIIFRISLN